MCRCAYPQEFLLPFFLAVMAFLNLDICVKFKILLNIVCQRNSSETAQQNFLKLCSNEGHNVQMCISTGNFDSIFFSWIYALFELRNLMKMKDTTETVGQHNSTETDQQNCVKLCSYEGHNVQMRISTGNFDSIFFLSELRPF